MTIEDRLAELLARSSVAFDAQKMLLGMAFRVNRRYLLWTWHGAVFVQIDTKRFRESLSVPNLRVFRQRRSTAVTTVMLDANKANSDNRILDLLVRLAIDSIPDKPNDRAIATE